MRIFGFSPTRTTRVTWTLAELGIEAEGVTENVFAHRELPLFHPLKRIPALDIDGKGLFESAAICNYLADSQPEVGLIARSGTWERALHDQWVSFALTEMEAWAWSTFRSMNIVSEGERVPEMYDFNQAAYRNSAVALEEALSTREYLVDDKFSATDIIVGWTCHFGETMGYNDGFANIKSFVERLMARPNCTLPALN